MNKKFKDCLFEVYLGEQAGEMIFESLLALSKIMITSIFIAICFN